MKNIKKIMQLVSISILAITIIVNPITTYSSLSGTNTDMTITPSSDRPIIKSPTKP